MRDAKKCIGFGMAFNLAGGSAFCATAWFLLSEKMAFRK